MRPPTRLSRTSLCVSGGGEPQGLTRSSSSPTSSQAEALGTLSCSGSNRSFIFPWEGRGSEKRRRRSQGTLAKRLPSGQENWKPQCCEKQLPEGSAQPSTWYDIGTPISWGEGINETFFILPSFVFPVKPEPVIDTGEREKLEQWSSKRKGSGYPHNFSCLPELIREDSVRLWSWGHHCKDGI